MVSSFLADGNDEAVQRNGTCLMRWIYERAGAVVVSTPQDIALIDAVKGINMFKAVRVPVGFFRLDRILPGLS